MRIALSGSHAVGKTSLLNELQRHLLGYESIEEPYAELLLAGHEFADPPSADDFVAQLEHSIARIGSDNGTDRLYDRCPADFLAYLAATDFETREWIGAAHDALSTIDLIVFVPIEQLDRIRSGISYARPRVRVDELLRQMLMDSHMVAVPPSA
jgi:GTPase SAR1 family protein